MKQWMIGLGIVFMATSSWSAPTEFKFISVLSAPMGSFGQVDTKSCKAVKVDEEDTLNIGSEAASSGAIALAGTKPAEITTLTVPTGKELAFSNNHWIIDQNGLTIGAQGNVTVDAILISTLTFANDAYSRQIGSTNKGTLRLFNSSGDQIWVQDAQFSTITGKPQFTQSGPNSTPASSATWKDGLGINSVETSQGVTNDDDTKFYPIRL